MKKLSKAELIKVFTKVPNEFIDDFYGTLEAAQNTNTSNYEFPINLELLCKWLQCKTITIRRTLHKSYVEDIDYKETKCATNIGRGGSNKISVVMTIDCFKRLCMRSKTQVAEHVRTYFIELDEFVSHYSDQISDGIMNDIAKVAKNLKNNPKDGPGWIYAFRVAKGFVKLGKKAGKK